jgi:mRNA interferase RelE/StbE
MVCYEQDVEKDLSKGKIPKEVFVHLNNAFISIDATKDLTLFDIRKLTSKEETVYYRLRKGKYRAIFYLENDNVFVIKISKREDIYIKWE